jgi:hypothetical protein
MCFNPGKGLVVLVYVTSVRESVNFVKSENSSTHTHTHTHTSLELKLFDWETKEEAINEFK